MELSEAHGEVFVAYAGAIRFTLEATTLRSFDGVVPALLEAIQSVRLDPNKRLGYCLALYWPSCGSGPSGSGLTAVIVENDCVRSR